MAGPVIGEATIVVGADGQLFAKQVDTQAEKAGKSGGSKFSGALGKTLKTGALFAGGAVAGILGTALAKGFSRLKAIDDAKAKLTGLGHSAVEVQGIMDSALASVKGTSFGLGDAAGIAASSVAAGVKPGKDLERTLKLVADAATIGGTSLSDMGLIFNKVAGTGKVQGEVLQQLGERGIPILQLLSKSMGKTPAQVQKLAAAGKIGFAQFQDAMQKGMGGAALSSGKTFTGGLKNVGAALSRLGAGLLGGVFAKLPGVFEGLIGWIDKITPAATAVGNAIGGVFAKGLTFISDFFSDPAVQKGAGDVFAKIGDAVKEFGPVILDTFSQVGAAVLPVFKSLSGAVGPLSTMFQTAGKVLVQLWSQVGPAIAGALQQVLPVIAQLVQFFVSQLLPAVTSLYQYLASLLIPIIKIVVQVFQAVVPVVVMIAKWFVSTLLPAILKIAKSVAANLKPVFDQLVASFRANLLPALLKLVAKFKEWWPTISKVIMIIVTLVGWVLKLAAWLLGKLLPPIIKVVFWLAGKLIGAIGMVIGWIVKIIGWIIKIGTAFVNSAAAVGRFVKAVVGKIAEVLGKVKEIPGKVKGALSGAASWLYNAGKDIVQGLIDGVSSMAGAIGDAFLNKIPGWIKGPFKKALGIGSPSKVFKNYGVMVMQGFVLGLTRGSSVVISYMKSLMAKLAKAGETGALKIAQRANRLLVPLGKSLDALNARLAAGRASLQMQVDAYNEAFSGLFDTLSQSGTFGDDAVNTFDDIVASLTSSVTKTQEFAAALASLKAQGLNPVVLKQISDAGLTALDAAKSLAAAGPAGIAQVNALQGQLSAAATDAAQTTASALYQSSITAAQAFVDTVAKGRAGVIHQMELIANAMLRGISAAVARTKGKGYSRVKGHAAGTSSYPGGLGLFGEKGPELAVPPRGTKIVPAGPTAALLRALPSLPGTSGRGGAAPVTTTVTSVQVALTVSVDDLAKLHRIEDFLAMLDRARVVSRKTMRSGTVNA